MYISFNIQQEYTDIFLKYISLKAKFISFSYMLIWNWKLIMKKCRLLLYNLKHILHILCIILQRKTIQYKQHNDKYLLISKESRSFDNNISLGELTKCVDLHLKL
jgi:hypothetical protein